MLSFKQGQDMPLFLLAVAVSARLMARRPALAGFILALLGLKAHLILLIPVLFAARRAWRMAIGFAAGGASLVAACFALYGTAWPSLWLNAVTENEKHIRTWAWIKSFGPAWFATLIALAVVSAIVARKVESAQTALFATLALSLIIGTHLYPYDLVPALPLAAAIFQRIVGPVRLANARMPRKAAAMRRSFLSP